MKYKIDMQTEVGEAELSDAEAFLRNIDTGARVQSWREREIIFSQGDPAASLFHINDGRVRLTTSSSEGKVATIAILGKGDLLGEECLVPGRVLRLTNAVAITDCSSIEVEKNRMLDAFACDCDLVRFFTNYLLFSKIRAQEELADRLMDSSERRLIRVLLLLAGPASNGTSNGHFLPEISQETLAEIVGTTRPRISYFMTKFKKMGLIDYSRGLQVSKELESLLR